MVGNHLATTDCEGKMCIPEPAGKWLLGDTERFLNHNLLIALVTCRLPQSPVVCIEDVPLKSTHFKWCNFYFADEQSRMLHIFNTPSQVV